VQASREPGDIAGAPGAGLPWRRAGGTLPRSGRGPYPRRAHWHDPGFSAGV